MKISTKHSLLLFCLLLIAGRGYLTGHISFLFLVWNLFLAWLPLFFIRCIKAGTSVTLKRILISLSVLFLPNAPYIITDLFHLKENAIVPMWYDLILILSFSVLGIICFFITLELILTQTAKIFPRLKFVKEILFISTGYGIYLGRYLRFNSWEVVSDPFSLAKGMFESVFNYGHLKETAAITITFSVFLYLIFEIYLSFKNKTLYQQHELH